MYHQRTSPSMRTKLMPLLLLSMLTALAYQLSWFVSSTAFHMAAPQVLNRALGPQSHAAVMDRPHKVQKKSKGNETIMNLTLQLGSGWGETSGVRVTNGASWATCFVEYDDASPQGRHLLEQWVMRGDDVDAFRLLQQTTSRANHVSVRCSPTSVTATQDVICLECISPTGTLPFTPASSILPGHVSSSSEAIHANPAMIFGNLQQCLETTVVGQGFCKSGSLSVPL